MKYTTNLRDELNVKYRNFTATNNGQPTLGDIASDTELTQLMSVVKRINQRKREFEKVGATSSLAYSNINSAFMDLPNYTQGKGDYAGNIYLRQGKRGFNDLKSMSIEQARRLLAINANEGTNWGVVKAEAKKLAISLGLPTDIQTLVNLANEEGDLHDFIAHYTSAYYNVYPDLEAAVHRSGQLTEDEALKMRRVMYEYNHNINQARDRANQWEADNMY